MYFDSNLSYLRKKKGLTQDAVAEYLCLTPQAIGLYEKGDREPTLQNLTNIARYFEVTVDDLLMSDLQPSGYLLSSNLRYLRKKIGYQQNEVCKLLNVSQPALANYENGARTPSVDGLVNISEFFGVTVDDLLKKDLSKGE